MDPDRVGLRISEAAVHNWVEGADIADGLAAAPSASESGELREARKRLRLRRVRVIAGASSAHVSV